MVYFFYVRIKNNAHLLCVEKPMIRAKNNRLIIIEGHVLAACTTTYRDVVRNVYQMQNKICQSTVLEISRKLAVFPLVLIGYIKSKNKCTHSEIPV